MRLWHQSLIKHLPRQQLLGQHRECCALRGKGWGRNHSVVNYVFKYNPARLVAYHYLIMREMRNRSYSPSVDWLDVDYRGTALGVEPLWCDLSMMISFLNAVDETDYMIFPEHNDEYLQECIDNLKQKGIDISDKLSQ